MQISRPFSKDEWRLLLDQLPNEAILYPFAQVCREWNLAAHQQLMLLRDNLLRIKLRTSESRFSKKDIALISWTIDKKSSTSQLISKFILSGASDGALMKAIKVANIGTCTNQHMAEALDSKRSAAIIKTLVCNNPETSKRGIASAIALKYRSILQILLSSETPKFTKYSEDWVTKKAQVHKAVDFVNNTANYIHVVEKFDIDTIHVAKYFFTNLYEFLDSTPIPVAHIMHLNLKGVKANSIISDYEWLVHKFSHIKSLFISDEITDRCFKVFTNLVNLENLDIKSNELKCLSEIGSLTNLINLSFHGCRNLKEIPSEIKNLTRLQRLNLTDCGSSQVFTFPDLSNLSSLKELNIIGSSIELHPNFHESIGHLLNINQNLKVDVVVKIDEDNIDSEFSFWPSLSSFLVMLHQSQG